MNTGRSERIGAVALFLVPFALAGCVSDRPDPNRPDPLTGLPRRVPTNERAVSSTYAPERTDAAVMASAGTSSLGIRDGRAPETDRNAVPASSAWTGNDSRSNAGPGFGAKLGAPPSTASAGTSRMPAVGDFTLATSNVNANAEAGAGVRVRTFEEAQRYLAAHRVKWQELQSTGEGEWKFSCSVPNKGSSTSMRTYEARDQYGLVAMQKVIDQMARDAR